MGPFASARMLEVMLKMSRDNYGAINDEDFPQIFLISIPVKNFFLDKKQTPLVLKEINMKVKILEKGQVSAFGIACNTAHILKENIIKHSDMEFVSMIEQTVNDVERIGIRKVGILASPVTITTKLYQSELEERGIEVYNPNKVQLALLGQIIADLVSCKNASKNRDLLLGIAKTLVDNGAEAIILGCTELPLVFPKRFEVPVISSIDALAGAMIKKCYINK